MSVSEEKTTRGKEEIYREREREREQRERRESGVIVGRLTTPHDLIVMLKTAGEAGKSVGGRDASHHILQCCVTEGGHFVNEKLCQGSRFYDILTVVLSVCCMLLVCCCRYLL